MNKRESIEERVIWCEDRDNIFLQQLAHDIRRLDDAGFDVPDITKMIGTFKYVKIWSAWPKYIFPADDLPKGYKWSDGAKFHHKSKFGNETYFFLPAGDDLYIRDGKYRPLMPGLNFQGKTFIRVTNYQKRSAVEVAGKITATVFLENCILKFWKESGLRVGRQEPLRMKVLHPSCTQVAQLTILLKN